MNKIELNEDFLNNCERNNLEEVKSCLSQGADVNTVSEDGRWSGLTIAAHKNNTELLDILLSQPDIEINKTTDATEAAQLSSLQFKAVHFPRPGPGP